MARLQKSTRGRQRIKMEKITNEANLAVTFSRRRLTAYKSAFELCTLTGAEVALIIFSPGNKPCSFGCPDVHSVIDRYLSNGLQPYKNPMEQFQNVIVSRNLSKELMDLQEMLEQEKKCAQVLDNTINERRGKYWWDAPIDTLDLRQLKQLKTSLENLCSKIDLDLKATTSSPDLQDHYKETVDFSVPQSGTLPLDLNGGVSVGGASSSTMPPSIQMDFPFSPPTNFNASQQSFAGSSTIQGDVLVIATSMPNQIDISTMAVNQMAVLDMAASSSNQMNISARGISCSNQKVTVDANEKESASIGVPEHAGPSRVDADSQPFFDDLGFTYGSHLNDDDEDWLNRVLDQI